MKIKTLLLVVNLCKFPRICPRWRCDIFTDKNVPFLLREARRPFCKKMAAAAFCLWKISIPFTENKRKGKWSWTVAKLCFLFPTFWFAFMTNHCAQRLRVKFNHALNLQMHFRKKILHFLLRTGNFVTKVWSYLALMLLYSQWLS